MELKGWGMTNLLPTCAKMADCLHYLRSVRFFHADNIDNPDLIKALEIGEKVHADLLALSGDNWVSVDDELPKEFETALLFGKKYNGEPLITNGHLIQSLVDEFGINDGFSVKVLVTHWQPLPQPPKEQQ